MKDEALQMCLEYIETDAHERKYVRHAIKQALAAPVQDTDAHYKGVVEGVQKLFDDKRAQPAPVKVWEAEGYDALMQEMQMVKARNIRQHAEIERLKAAQPAVPDAMTSADIQEHIEYVAGWNDCRAEMLKGMK